MREHDGGLSRISRPLLRSDLEGSWEAGMDTVKKAAYRRRNEIYSKFIQIAVIR